MVAAVFVVNRWHVVSPGYAWLVDACASAFALFAWAAGGRSRAMLAAASLLALGAILSSVAGVVRAGRRASRSTEGVSMPAIWAQAGFEVAAAAAALAAVVQIGASGGDPPWIAVLRALGGAAFLGAVTDSMILGHWYLIDPKLPKVAIRRLDMISAGALAVNTVLVLVPPLSILTMLGEANLLVLGWVATTVFCAILVLLVHRALQIEGYASVMSATGLLYVATMVAVGVLVTGQMATS